jgi:hypothetical protein
VGGECHPLERRLKAGDVPVGSRVRASFRVEELTEVDGGAQARIAASVEREGQDKPVCVAELVFRLLR